jgi:hypothetical protein
MYYMTPEAEPLIHELKDRSLTPSGDYGDSAFYYHDQNGYVVTQPPCPGIETATQQNSALTTYQWQCGNYVCGISMLPTSLRQIPSGTQIEGYSPSNIRGCTQNLAGLNGRAV